MENKKLNLEYIKKLSDSTEEWEIKEIQGMELKVKSVFSTTGINNLFKTLGTIISETQSNSKLKEILDDEKILHVIMFLMVKEFTDLGQEIGNTTEEIVKTLYQLENSGLLVEIINSLPVNEVNKVFQMAFQILQNAEEVLKLERDSKLRVLAKNPTEDFGLDYSGLKEFMQ